MKKGFIDFLRKICGYYNLEEQFDEVFTNYKKLIALTTNKTPINISYKFEDVAKYYERAKKYGEHLFLVKELEGILDTVQNNGTNPKDVIRRVIKEAQRQIGNSDYGVESNGSE